MEVKVKQRTPEWFEARKKVTLTASKFGEALGLGRGKPYDFFVSLIVDSEHYQEENEQTRNMSHGIKMEKIIGEAYELLTGCKTNETGFWVPQESDLLAGYVGASPDALVCEGSGLNWTIGLAEFKAPIYKLYSGDNLIHGIPRAYMAQIQGQMAICRMQWCDFMAVCVKTKEIMLKRVHFCREYWQYISMELIAFCQVLKESRLRKQCGKDILGFDIAEDLRLKPFSRKLFPGEASIKVVNQLQTGPNNKFLGPGRVWLPFDMLMGVKYELPPSLRLYGDRIIDRIDKTNKKK
ncbi:XP_029646454.1uncharacterized protein LOC115220466 isoform X2 [Octopus vulgaris]|uniref:XP_029646454.1uncharacterized protein LOC115220466 isoform X2 n=1 Tax=Octopus vulgaris TaxID=6645 RepID=A0AA36FD65_OCTVU|nr:XP_029646454.1uncharacterized protein LOC115220466 isoform X2 [Octopus vulgaris]